MISDKQDKSDLMRRDTTQYRIIASSFFKPRRSPARFKPSWAKTVNEMD